MASGSGVSGQPGVEIGHTLEIEQGLSQGLQPLQRQAANPAFLLRAQGAAAASQQAQGALGFSLSLSKGDAAGFSKGDPST